MSKMDTINQLTISFKNEIYTCVRNWRQLCRTVTSFNSEIQTIFVFTNCKYQTCIGVFSMHFCCFGVTSNQVLFQLFYQDYTSIVKLQRILQATYTFVRYLLPLILCFYLIMCYKNYVFLQCSVLMCIYV